MAVPKHKTSKQRTHSRGSQWKLSAPTLVECKNCHQLVQLHRVCPSCGSYDNEIKIEKNQGND
ncbi:MAG: 50S ribosomal protein L32 [Clostridiales bacterium]|nr:50S ribosomal protein L32 [Clostridiales bacterium]